MTAPRPRTPWDVFLIGALLFLGYQLPRPVDWVPLVALALAMGPFAAVFFRGFGQTRPQASLGTVQGIGTAAAPYAQYHLGYGMGPGQMPRSSRASGAGGPCNQDRRGPTHVEGDALAVALRIT